MKTTFPSMRLSSLLLLVTVLSAGCSLLRWNAELPRRTFQTVMGGTEGGASIDAALQSLTLPARLNQNHQGDSV